MRFRFTRCAALLVITINVIVVYYLWKSFIANGFLVERFSKTAVNKTLPKPVLKRISKLVTIIIPDYSHENDIAETVLSFINTFPNLQILVVSKTKVYPPLKIPQIGTENNVKVISLSPNLAIPYNQQYPLHYVKTKYVLFVPDNTRILNRQSLQNILNSKVTFNILAIPFSNNKVLDCLNSSLNARNWTLFLESKNSVTCDMITGNHGVLMETDVLKQLPNAFLLPFPNALYLQTSALNYTVTIHSDRNVLYLRKSAAKKSYHLKWKQDQELRKQLQLLYQIFSIKFVRKNHNIEWYGCSKETINCFHPVLNGTPSYIYENKFTPPCCLANLRKTALHVFTTLEEFGMRYWLDHGSLLGAMKYGDIIPWDYNVDVGIYRDDVGRCTWLKETDKKSVVDKNGFLWERLPGENYSYRVYYSKKNRLFVNLYVFSTRNGTMVRNDRKTLEFSERFLHPMSSIEFLGRFVPTPNNINDFLETEFGTVVLSSLDFPDWRNDHLGNILYL